MPEPILSPTLSEASSIGASSELLPTNIQDAIQILTVSQQQLIARLYVEGEQCHLFDGYTSAVSPSVRRQFAQQLELLDTSYADGGLVGYVQNAKQLLENSRKGINPLEGWTPNVPDGTMFKLGTDPWKKAERDGAPQLGMCGFVLVAGGLGERLQDKEEPLPYKGLKVKRRRKKR